MSTRERTHVNALKIFGWLVVITAAELGLVIVDMPKKLLVPLLLGSAIAKAALVAFYFMDLRFERRLVLAVVTLPILTAVAFVLLLFPDIVSGYWR